MRIKVLRNFYQSGRMYQTGSIYQVDDLRVNPEYYTVLDRTAPTAPPTVARKRAQTTQMKPSEVTKVVMKKK